MDYLVPSSPVLSHLSLFAILDLEHNAAIIPGDGDNKVVFTHTKDVGAYVAAALELEAWNEASFIVGEKLSLNDIVGIAEEVKGRRLRVERVSVEDLKARKIPELEYNKQRYETLPKVMVDAIFGIWGEAVLGGWLDFGADQERSGLNVEMMGVKEFFRRS